MKYLLILIAVVTTFCLFSMGCASVTEYDGKGNIIRHVEGRGFFRDVDASRKLPDGTIESLSTKSTTSDIMNAANKIIGTAAGIAGQAIP
jgi:hypothetical protein